MDDAADYRAPWGLVLKIATGLTTVVCLGISVLAVRRAQGVADGMALLPVIILMFAAPFCVRGYRVTADAVLVRRLFWTTRLPRAGLLGAQIEPGVMGRSIRACGNGGLFVFAGLFWNRALGFYRAYVTDFERTVVLRYAGRTVVVSPENPERFVASLNGKV